jgi:TRAP-type transport system periplasmic protein
MAIVVALGLATATATTTPSHAGAPAAEINLAHGQIQDPASDPAAAAAAEFKIQVEALTGDTIRVNIFPGEQVGGDRDMALLVGRGVIQSALVTVGGIDADYPLIAVALTPFAMPSIEMALASMTGSSAVDWPPISSGIPVLWCSVLPIPAAFMC